MIEAQRTRSGLRCTILRELHAQFRNHRGPWAAELGGTLDTRPLLAAEAWEGAANLQYPGQQAGGSGRVIG